MTFDGVRYGGVRLIAPAEYHPRLPITGAALSASLRGAYMYSRERARLICCQTYPRLGIDAARLANLQNGNLQFARIGTSWTRCWTVDRTIPDHHTHLVIRVALQVAVYATTTLSVRATYKNTNGDAVDVNILGAVPGPGYDVTDPAYNRQRWQAETNATTVPPGEAPIPFRMQPDIANLSDVVEVVCDVTLPGSHDTGIDLGFDCKSTSTGDDRPALRLASLVAWSEVRD